MSFQVDSNTMGAIVMALGACVAAAGRVGWDLRGRRAQRDHRHFVEDLQFSDEVKTLRTPEAPGIIKVWWDAGYAIGYRDGKNNRRRQDATRHAARQETL
jgi:hypothetical protein